MMLCPPTPATPPSRGVIGSGSYRADSKICMAAWPLGRSRRWAGSVWVDGRCVVGANEAQRYKIRLELTYEG